MPGSTSRTASSNSNPVRRGITRSVRMMLGRNCETFCRPSSPSAAESVRNPHVRTNSVSPDRAALSSSTMSTRSDAFWVWRSASVMETVVLMSPWPCKGKFYTILALPDSWPDARNLS